MLHALLRNKLGRLADDDARLVHGAGDAFTRLEDPLTAAVFERLRYLPAGEWWAVLGAAARGADAWPSLPEGGPEWRFWPSLDPAVGGANAVRVEPDVLVVFATRVLVVEAKHHAPQTADQRAEQLGAVARAWPGRPTTFLAVGGLPVAARAGAFHATWGDVRDALREAARGPGLPAERRHALDDAHAAIVRWGYRPRAGLGALVASHARLRADRPQAEDPPADAVVASTSARGTTGAAAGLLPDRAPALARLRGPTAAVPPEEVLP